jgi:hypothetical protein
VFNVAAKPVNTISAKPAVVIICSSVTIGGTAMARRRTNDIMSLSEVSIKHAMKHSMTNSLKSRAVGMIAAGIATLLFGFTGLLGGPPPFDIAAKAQTPSEPSVITVPVPPADRAAIPNMTKIRCHILPVQTGYGARAQGEAPIRPDCDDLHKQTRKQTVTGPASTDLNFHGGPFLSAAQDTFIFLNCPTSCLSDWGNPIKFLGDLFIGVNTPFIHVADQYVGTTGHYAMSTSPIHLTGNQPHTLSDSQLRAVIMLGIKSRFPQGGGGGYNQMYSIFLPQGQDLCFDNSGVCYCPDNNCNGGSFAFCAYHGSFNSTDAVGAPIHVIYQAQPYDNVPGCQVTNGPNGTLVDSTNNVLSHEIFETITDPDLNAWFRSSDGSEIGDICNFNLANPISLNANRYAIQKEYSNIDHQCVSAAPTVLTLNKILVHPDTRHLRLFNLQIDGVTVRANANGGSTGPQSVTPGNHTVGETGGTGTPLGAFFTVIGGACAADGTVSLTSGDNKACTITNYDNTGGCAARAICCEPGDGTRGCLECSAPGRGCP